MTTRIDATSQRRLEQFLDRVGDVLGSDSRRGSFAMYAMGLLGDGERKSIEPIAARACADPKSADALHQRLLHFAADSKWSDAAIRRVAAEYAISAMTERGTIETWIVDDTGFLKQGTHSVGVQRQYTGSAGKVTNCQIGVSLTIATQTEHVPVDFGLYLPKTWIDDPERRAEARIPGDKEFQTKPELALEMIRRGLAIGIAPGVLLADSAYGTSRVFRREVRSLGLHYAVGVDSKTTVRLLDKAGRPSAKAVGVRKLALDIRDRGGFRRCTWREGTNGDMTALFAMRRVIPAHAGAPHLSEREHLWLLIEWRDGDPEPANYFLASLPATITKKRLVQIVMQRWRTERVYQDLKGELGLDHFEGRSFPGWHHHVSIALCCYAFTIAERVRRFPPSGARSSSDHAQHFAA